MSAAQDPEAAVKEATARVLACGARPSDVLDGMQRLRVAQALGLAPDARCFTHVAGLLLQLGQHGPLVAWYDELRRENKVLPPPLFLI